MLNTKTLQKKELDLSVYQGEDKMISSHELQELLKKDDGKTFSFSTGITVLDRILGQVESGELVVVTGPTGHGKTTLLMDITSKMANKGVLSAWFSLEVTPRQFIQKLTFGDKPLPMFYTPSKNTDSNVHWIIDRIIEAKMKYEVSTVFIDHLHQIFSIDKFNGKNLSLELGDVVAKIKQIAIEYNLVVFLVTHSTDDKSHTSREPKMMDIRDSGMISRLADTVLGIWRVKNDSKPESATMLELDEDDTWAKVRIWKNRRTGKLGYFLLNHENHSYIEIDPTRRQEAREEFNKFSR